MKNLSKAILAFGFIVLIFSLHKITQSKAQDGLPILWDKESYLKEFQEKTAQTDNLILTKSKAIPLKSKIALTGTITITGINVSDCNSADNTYSIDVTISYSGVSGDISVNGTSFTPDGTSPDTFTISGLNSTGIMGNCVTAASVNTPSCNDQSFYNAPAPCQAPPTIYNIATEDGNTVTACNGIFVDSGGSGSDYADNENYNVTFCSGSSEKIILDFTSFDVEPDGTCQYDKISIYDGTSTSDPLIGEYCGTNSPGIVVSSDSCLHVVFVSDGGATRPGWEANIFCESNYIYNTNSCRNTVLLNNGYEDTGSATFGSTFEGYPAEVLAGSGPNPIPQWFNNFTECSSGCTGYWIYDNTNTINNPDGQYFAWLNGDNDCFSQYGIDVTNGTCYQICVDAAAWSNPGPQDTTHLFVEVRGSSIYGGSLHVIYDQVLPASTSFTDLNWQKICFNWTAPGNDNIEFIISQRNTSTGLLIDRVCFNEVNCSATSISNISLSNQSSCNDNGSDDYYTADVIVSYTNPAPSGSLVLSGNTFAIEAVGNLDGPTSHTFTGVRLPANGQTTSIMAFFDEHNGSEYVLCDIPAVNSCSSTLPCTDYDKFHYFLSATPADNSTDSTAFMNLLPGMCDYEQDFESYNVGDNLDNTDLGGLEFRLRNRTTSGDISAETTAGSSTFNGTRGAMLPDGDELRLYANNDEFSYIGFYVYNLTSGATMDIEFKDRSDTTITIDPTGSCAGCGEFIGLIAPAGDYFDRIEITPNGSADWGIDDLKWGNFHRVCHPCPMIVHWDMENCDVGELDEAGFLPIINSNACMNTVTNLRKRSGSNSCGGSSATIGRGMCHGPQNNPTWVDDDPTSVQWEVTYGPEDSGSLSNLDIFFSSRLNCPGTSTPANQPQQAGLRVLKDGVEIYKEIGVAVTLNYRWHTFDFSSNPDFTFSGATTYRFEFLAYDPAPGANQCYVIEIDEMELYGCCSSTPPSFCPSTSNNITLLVGELLDSGGGRTEIINFDKDNPTMCPTPLPDGGEGIVYDRNRDAVWIVDFNTDEIVLYDMTTQQVTHRITGYPCTFDIALSNDGNYLYGASCSDVFRIDISNLSSPTLSGLRVDTDFAGQGKTWGIAVHPTTGEVYVSKGFQAPGSSYTSTISRLAANLTGAITTIASASDGGIFMGLTFDPSGNLWAVKDGAFTVNDSIIQYDASGTVLQGLTWMPGLTTNHSAPNDIAIGPDGDVYVATYFEYCVLRYNIGPGTWEEYLPFAPGAGGKIIEFVCGEIACKPCISSSVYSDNCSGAASGPFTADWQFIVNAPDSAGAEVQWSRNGSSFTDFTLVTDIDTITIAGIPADGGAYDTLVVRYKNKPSCADTIIRKRPNPCPPNTGIPSGEVCNGNLTANEIGGTVYEDMDFNGAMSQNDTIGVQGVIVSLYDCDGSFVGSTFTDINGVYKFDVTSSSSTEFRVEFTLPERIACWACPTPSGVDNGTMVQFVGKGVCANLGISSASEFCAPDAYITTPCYVAGDQSTSTMDVLVSFNNTWGATSGTNAFADWQVPSPPNHLSQGFQMGATYGTAWSKKRNKLYVGAYHKHISGFGPLGPDGIYEVPMDPATGQPIGGVPIANKFVELEDDLGLSVGSDSHGDDLLTIPVITDASLGNVGKTSLGDLEISEDESTLYTVNLTTRQIIAIDINSQSIANTYTFPFIYSTTPNGLVPGCPNPSVDFRPFALGMHKGQLFVGGVSSAESTQNPADLHAYVYTLDLNSGTFNLVLNYALRAERADWLPWENTWADLRAAIIAAPNNAPDGSGHLGSYGNQAPQPMIVDIEFYKDAIILGLRDRTADQLGPGVPDPLDSGHLIGYNSMGDIDCAGATENGSYEIERADGGFASICGCRRVTYPADGTGYTPSAGDAPNGEFYYGDGHGVFDDHVENAYGGLLQIGHQDLIYNGHNTPEMFRAGTANTGGIGWMSNQTGAGTKAYLLYQGMFAKAAGLGDLEALCEEAPIQIGNYVWEDTNNNGIQDACEPGIPNVEMTLFIQNGSGCQSIATYMTDANGNYYFDNLIPDTTYYVVAGTGGQWSSSTLSVGTSTYQLTSADQGSNDQIDSDGIEGTGSDPACVNGLPFTTVNTGSAGCTDHKYDFGFTTQSCNLSASVYSNNCSGTASGPFTADWQFVINAPDSAGTEVQWSRNGSAFTDFTLVTDIDTITIAGIPADGGAYDTLVVRYKNKPSCSDIIIVKRPNPCPPDVSSCSNLSGCLAGKVFNDYNFNGINEVSEPGIQGVKVLIFNNSNNPVGTTYSDSDGDWQMCSLTDGDDYRIEFIVPERISCWAKPTLVGSSNGSSVQFSTAPNCVNFSLSNPADYCQIDADVIVPCFLFGNPLSHTGREAIISDPYNDRTGPPHVTTWATMEEVGTTYGVAYDKKTDVIYAAAYARRYTGFGPGDVGANGSSGAIYQIDRAGNVSVLIDLDPASPSNPNPGLYSTGPNIHPNTTTNFNCDPMWFEVGMMSWGDIDINEDGTQLYAMNMYDRALYIIDTRTGAILGRHIIPGVTGGPTWTEPMCSNDPDTDLRPMATKYRNGKVYIGITCAAMSTGSTNNDLGAFVWAFDLASGQYHPSSDLYIDLSLNATDWNSAPHVNGSTRHFYEWTDPSSSVYNTRNPTPILADLEFDGDDLIIGFRNVTKDRIAALTGTFLPDCTTPQPTNGNSGGANGRVLRACFNGSRWTMESGGNCGGVTGFGSDGYSGANGNAWTTYYEQFNAHFADYSGAIAIHHGENDVLTVGTTGGSQGGVMFIDQADFTSLSPNGGEAVIYSNSGSNPFAKTNGLGDIELACNPAPLEIGNYVWEDSNNNGIQDASELGISNVNVTLYIQNGSSCDSITTIQTDASGEYYFNDSTLAVAMGILNTDTTGLLIPDTTYYVVAGTGGQWSSSALSVGTSTYQLTSADQGSNDQIDSDGTEGTGSDPACVNGLPFTTVNTGKAGCADHSYDFGFIESIPNSISYGCGDGPAGCDVVIDRYIINVDTTAAGVPVSPFVIPGLNTTGQFKVEAYWHSRNSGSANMVNINGTAANYECVVYGTNPCSSTYNLAGFSWEDNSGTVSSLSITHDIAVRCGEENLPGIEVIVYRCAGTSETPSKITRNEVFQFLWAGQLEAGANPQCHTETVPLADGACTDGNANRIVDISLSIFNIHQAGYSPPRSAVVRFQTNTGQDTIFHHSAPPNNSSLTIPWKIPASATSIDVTLCTHIDFSGPWPPNPYSPPAWYPDPVADGYYYMGSSIRWGSVVVEDHCGDCGPPLASLGDTVWHDNNRNGIQDSGEEGISGVIVSLYDATTSTELSTTTTNSSGFYQFTGLNAGDYYVVFDNSTSTAASFVLTDSNQGSDDGIDSDADLSGKSHTVTLIGGQHDPTIDAGYYIPTPSLLSYGCADGPAGCDVVIDRFVVNIDTTAAGVPVNPFVIPGLNTTGQFRVEVYWHSRYSGSASMVNINGTAATPNCITYGPDPCINPSTFSAYSWVDSSGSVSALNITHDITVRAGEEDLPGIEVIVYRCVGASESPSKVARKEVFQFLYANSTTHSGSNPMCHTESIPLPDGDCSDGNANRTLDVSLSIFNIHQAGYTNGRSVVIRFQTDTGQDTVFRHSPPANNSYLSVPWTVPAGATTIDVTMCTDIEAAWANLPYTPPAWTPNAYPSASAAGYNVFGSSIRWSSLIIEDHCGDCVPPTASLGDTVWHDITRNGIQDSGEPGISGVTVTLYNATTSIVIATTTTNTAGFYEFTSLFPGDYYVVFDISTSSVPTFVLTNQNQGSDDAEDSDANTTTGRSHTITLTGGQHDPTIDAGYHSPCPNYPNCGGFSINKR